MCGRNKRKIPMYLFGTLLDLALAASRLTLVLDELVPAAGEAAWRQVMLRKWTLVQAHSSLILKQVNRVKVGSL